MAETISTPRTDDDREQARATPAPFASSSGHPFAVPGFDAVARMVVGGAHADGVVLVLADGSAFWFIPADEPGDREQLHPLLMEAAQRRHPHVVRDTWNAGVTPERCRHIRFLASEPVTTLSGVHAGALCLLGDHPRHGLAPAETDALRDGAAVLGQSLVLRDYLGRTDPVTQLPNRNAFFQDLGERLDTGEASIRVAAVEVAPVDRFNAFVRAMGHPYSDTLMRQAASRVRTWCGDTCGLYQVGATRFALVFCAQSPAVDAQGLDALVAALREPIDCEGIPLSLQPGVGLLEMDSTDASHADPLRRLMSASYMAMRSPRGWCRYSPEDDDHHRQAFFLVTELSSALRDHDHEFELHYQPRVDLDSGRCVSVEALARWRHPTLGYIPPSQFVPLAEQSALMRALTDWVFEEGCAQLARWRDAGRDIGLSFNVSSNDVVTVLIERLEAITARHGLGLEGIELEFTETSLMQQCGATHERLSRLLERGIRVAIDDFGTGYSNLSYLRQMPASTLKIDQSFVRSIMESPDDATIVSSVTQMARRLGFRVVVEGVENEAIFRIVRDMDCDEVQGFYVARPMPAAQLDDWLDHHTLSPLPPRHRP